MSAIRKKRNSTTVEPTLPESIGRFVPSEVLGRGAQGVVYLARDPSLKRDVAIKTLNRTGRDPDRLLAEAQKVSQLSHPNIVPIYEIGAINDLPYLVYEYVRGKSLKSFVDTGEVLQPQRLVRILLSVLNGIAHAHECGIVHRDLTPANILLDDKDHARILDFGVASFVSEVETRSDIIGTVSYMAPEVIAGKAVTGQADVFSIGAIAHELLTGQRLFTGDSSLSIMYRIMNEPITAPAVLNQDLDVKLDRIVMKALARDCEDRFADAAAMREALQVWLAPREDDESAHAPTDTGAIEFLMRRMRRRPDFPAVSKHVAEISAKARTGGDSDANALANVVLKDFALTTKLLRVVNSALYSQYGGGISTVSRAVVILGYEQVRAAALGIVLFEHLKDAHQAHDLKDAICSSFLSGMLARGVSGQLKDVDPEEAFVASLFHRLGKHLTIYYFPDEYEEIQRSCADQGLSEDQAARQSLGASYAEIGVAVGREWQLPRDLLGAMKPKKPKAKTAALNESPLAGVATLSNQLCDLMAEPSDSFDQDLKTLLKDWKDDIPIKTSAVTEMARKAMDELDAYASALAMPLEHTGFYQSVAKRYRGDKTSSPDATTTRKHTGSSDNLNENQSRSDAQTQASSQEAQPTPAADAPPNRLVGLTHAITDITSTLMGDFQLNQVLIMILEAFYRSMGFSRVLLCIRDGKSGEVRARFGFGSRIDEMVEKFRFRDDGAPDIFTEAMREGRDCIILDTHTVSDKHPVPNWCQQLAQPRSLTLFPIRANGKTIALVYADSPECAAHISADELRLVKALINQGALAVQHTRKR